METVFSRKDIRGNRERFGWILSLPVGRIDFYGFSVEEILDRPGEAPVTPEELDEHLLPSLQIEKDNFFLAHPVIASFEITRQCGLSCPHCYVKGGLPRTGEMSTAKIFSVMDELAAAGVFCLQISGGEPLEHPDILPLLSRAGELGFVTSLSTNGVHLSEDIINRLPVNNFSVAVSIDGLLNNGLIRGCAADFNNLKDKVLMLRDSGITFDVMLTLNKLNIDDAIDLIRWCMRNDIMLETLDTMPFGRCKENPGILLDAQDLRKDLAVYRMKEELEDYYEEKFGPRTELIYPGFLQFCYWINILTKRCKGSRSMVYIASDGSVYPCSNCASENIFCGGNLKEKSFREIWFGSFKDMRAITWEDFVECADCELGSSPYYCCGRCPALSHSINHGIYTGCGLTPITRRRILNRTREYVKMHQAKAHIQVNPARVVHEKE